MDDTLIQVVIILIGIVVTGMVPWAFFMERRLARIEVLITRSTEDRRSIEHLWQEVSALKVKVAVQEKQDKE